MAAARENNDSEGRRDEEAPVEIPIDGTLDLHTFRPGEMSEVVREYLRAAAEEGLDEVRIVHGKGKGVLRHGVIKLLEQLPIVESFRSGGAGRGEWGATIVTLKATRDEKR
jgi:dsDNA-specific endonuclease/ATPase MutS2